MRTLRAGAAYFGLVFGAGFALGVVRVLWLAPALGVRTAELLEMPLMLVVIVLSARWVVARFALERRRVRLAAGLLALSLLLVAEALLIALRGLRIAAYVAERDPVAGAAYLLMLALLAVMPELVRRKAR